MILSKFLNNLLIFNYIDLIEILFFSCLIYAGSIWLRNDKQKNLLLIFYSLLSLFITANFANMLTISNFFFVFWPCFILAFYLIHQRTLQKNFINLKKAKIQKSENINWLDDFIRSCLNAISKNKQITCIIEGNNNLAGFVKAPFILNANINQDMIDILTSCEIFDQQKMIWISQDAKIQAINCVWNIKNYDLWFDENVQTLTDWQQDAIVFTSKFDSLIFRTYPTKRTFDIVVQGKLIEDLSSNTALNFIGQFIKRNEIKNIKKGENINEAKSKNNWNEQPLA